jgi:hypothetical protein
MRTCIRCGSTPVNTTDGEVTCSKQTCPESRISFTIEEWENFKSTPIHDLLPMLEELMNSEMITLSFLNEFSSGNLAKINGMCLPMFIISQVSNVVMQKSRLETIIAWIKNE